MKTNYSKRNSEYKKCQAIYFKQCTFWNWFDLIISSWKAESELCQTSLNTQIETKCTVLIRNDWTLGHFKIDGQQKPSENCDRTEPDSSYRDRTKSEFSELTATIKPR